MRHCKESFNLLYYSYEMKKYANTSFKLTKTQCYRYIIYYNFNFIATYNRTKVFRYCEIYMTMAIIWNQLDWCFLA